MTPLFPSQHLACKHGVEHATVLAMTDHYVDGVQAATRVLQLLWREGYAYKKAGVIVSGIVPDDQMQAALWDERDRTREQRLMAAMDRLNQQHGRDMVRVAAQGYSRRWQMRNAMVSPRFTTRWNELMEVRC